MLRAIVLFSLKHWAVVTVSAFLLLAAALSNLLSARYDVFPEFAPPHVTVLTEAPGLSSDAVELLITQIVEQAISGASGVVSMRSSSIQGLSAIEVGFDLNSNVLANRQVIGERLADIASRLPAGVGTPKMTPLSSTTDIVMGVGLTSSTLNATELRSFADWQIKPQLLSISGVADAESYGGLVRQLQVQVHPEALVRYGLTLDESNCSGKTGYRRARCRGHRYGEKTYRHHRGDWSEHACFHRQNTHSPG